jgi:hypothetical protein
LYSRTTGYVTDADWQRIGFCRLKVAKKWGGGRTTSCSYQGLCNLFEVG